MPYGQKTSHNKARHAGLALLRSASPCAWRYTKRMRNILTFITILIISSKSYGNDLLGTWISEKEKTIDYVVSHSNPTQKQLDAYDEIYGKLLVTFTDEVVISDLEGFIVKEKYKITKHHDNMITVKLIDSEVDIEIVILDQNHIYQKLDLKPLTREYFKRVNTKSYNKASQQDL